MESQSFDSNKRLFKAMHRDANMINEYKNHKSKNKLLVEIKRVAEVNRYNTKLANSINGSKLTEQFNEPVRVR